MLRLAMPRVNLAHPMLVRVRRRTTTGSYTTKTESFYKVIAIDPEANIISGPYLTPAKGWNHGRNRKVILYRVPPNRTILNPDRDLAQDDGDPHGIFQTDDGYYPHRLLAPVPPPTTRSNITEAWRTITHETEYKNCNRELAAIRRQKKELDYANWKLTLREAAVMKTQHRLIATNTNTLLMCKLSRET
jgi:hypothetical protein